MKLSFNFFVERKICSRELGINLESGKEKEIFKWFLACLLFGKPIQQNVAKRAYFEFEKEGLLSPNKIIRAGWDRIVDVLDKGHYVRYDFSTATKIIEICKELRQKYGTITKLLKSTKSKNDLKKRLQEFNGIGPVTASIFIREIRTKKGR